MTFVNTPEHLHAILNHAPVVGLFAALLPLLWGLVRKRREIVVVGLLGVVVFGASAWIVQETGEAAAERLEDGVVPTVGQIDADSEAWLEEHEEAGKLAVRVILGAVVLAVAALWLARSGSRRANQAAWAAALVALLALGLGARAGGLGGLVRHPEFRGGSPPAHEEGEPGEGTDGDEGDGAWSPIHAVRRAV